MATLPKAKFGVAAVVAALAAISLECSAQSFPPGPPPGIAGNVTVVNTPLPVQVVNPPSAPSSVSVNNLPGLNPYQEFFNVLVPAPFGGTFPLAVVPANTRRVVQHVSCSNFAQTLGRQTQMRLVSQNTGAFEAVWSTHIPPTQFTPTLFGPIWVINTLRYFEAFDSPQIQFAAVSDQNSFSVDCLVSGYDVKLQ
jgi:hypothetical protein